MNSNRKTVTAHVYDTQDETVRVSIPRELYEAQARCEISTGIKLCGYHRGRKWGIVYTYNIWTRPNGRGEIYGDEYTAYRLDVEGDREAFDELCAEHNATCYHY